LGFKKKMSDFPDAIYTPRETENLPGISYDPANKRNMYSEDFQNLGAEINAIETILGTNPQGDFDTVKEWLESLGSGGNTWLTGSGVPSDGSGADGDLYLRTSNGDVYQKVSGSWGSPIANLKGPTGDAGADGTNGTDGTDGTNGTNGATWRTGSGAPSDGVGVDGDLYLRTSNGDVYKRSSGTYSVIANITGPTGATGSTGATGATGEGVASGGTTGQILAKTSDTDFDTEWIDPPSGGTPGLVRVGGDSSEHSYASPIAGDIVTISSLSIPAGTRVRVTGKSRYVCTSASAASLGFKVNSTNINNPGNNNSDLMMFNGVTGGGSENGIFWLEFEVGETNYPFSVVQQYASYVDSTFSADQTGPGYAGYSNALPSATITSIAIRAKVASVSDTIYVKNVQVYIYANS
jgi:hypothetical protein